MNTGILGAFMLLAFSVPVFGLAQSPTSAPPPAPATVASVAPGSVQAPAVKKAMPPTAVAPAPVSQAPLSATPVAAPGGDAPPSAPPAVPPTAASATVESVAPALLIIKDLPAGAVLKIDGVVATANDDQPFQGTPGDHKIEVIDGENIKTENITMIAGKTILLRYWLEREKNDPLNRDTKGLITSVAGALALGGGIWLGLKSEDQADLVRHIGEEGQNKKKYDSELFWGKGIQVAANVLFGLTVLLEAWAVYWWATDDDPPPSPTEPRIEVAPGGLTIHF